MARLKFQIVTPERTLLQDEADSLTCPTQMGEITVLPNHIPLIASLQPGELTARRDGKLDHYAVSGGFIEVRPGNEIIVLADTAEHSEEIDIARAEEAKRKAEEEMKASTTRSAEEYAQLAAVIQKNLARLKVSRRSRPAQGMHLNPHHHNPSDDAINS